MDSTHYLALFASYIVSDKVKEVLIKMAPLLDETPLNATEHQSFIESTLHYYYKIMENVVAFIGDNCTVNHKLSNDIVIPLFVYASNFFNLAVNQWIEANFEYAKIIQKIHALYDSAIATE